MSIFNLKSNELEFSNNLQLITNHINTVLDIYNMYVIRVSDKWLKFTVCLDEPKQ